MTDALDDPFAPEADPYPPAQGGPLGLGLTRRALGRLAVLAAPASALPLGCATTPSTGAAQLGCEPKPSNPQSCRHRFCRYYRPG